MRPSRRHGDVQNSLRSNLVVALASLLMAVGALELWFRLHPPTDVQTNNEYHYRTREGERHFGVPLHAWSERFDPELDVRGYYAKSDYTIAYRFDHLGARWLSAETRDLRGRVVVVLGDSFTYGSGLHYEDTWVHQLERRLTAGGESTRFLDFAESAAGSVRCLEIYAALDRSIAHDEVLYALHLNDVVSFGTSEVIRNQMLGSWLDRHSRLVEFVLKRLNTSIGRRLKLARLTSPDVFERRRFRKNFPAILELKHAAAQRGARFRVALLPVLLELHDEGFRPVYEELSRRLREQGIEVLDVTDSVQGRRESDLWILPVDQHPNEIASALFADGLHEQWER